MLPNGRFVFASCPLPCHVGPTSILTIPSWTAFPNPRLPRHPLPSVCRSRHCRGRQLRQQKADARSLARVSHQHAIGAARQHEVAVHVLCAYSGDFRTFSHRSQQPQTTVLAAEIRPQAQCPVLAWRAREQLIARMRECDSRRPLQSEQHRQPQRATGVAVRARQVGAACLTARRATNKCEGNAGGQPRARAASAASAVYARDAVNGAVNAASGHDDRRSRRNVRGCHLMRRAPRASAGRCSGGLRVDA